MVDLSIIVVSYNTRELLLKTLDSLDSSLKHDTLSYEVIVVDNGSTDGSQSAVKLQKKNHNELSIIETGENLGFSKANNRGVAQAKGEYILFLNSDTIVASLKASELISYMKADVLIGALTVKLVLPNGDLDPACHRGFPTVWRSFAYMSGLEKRTSPLPILNRLFGGYHLTHLSRKTIHEVDVISGAFFLMKKALFEKLNGFDETFFMYGEDVDLAFRIKKAGYKIIYYPEQTITHIKGQSGMKKENDAQKKQTSAHFYDAMKLFYNKNYRTRYPFFINNLVMWAIDRKLASLGNK